MTRSHKVFVICAGLVLLILFLNQLFLSAPASFAAESIFSVEPGMSLRAVSSKLKSEGFIRSRIFFEAFVILHASEKHVVSTDYYFEKKLPVYELARRIVQGKSALAPIRLTIPEGFTNLEIAKLALSKLPNFDQENFLDQAKGEQGYLFPDTYFFLFRAEEAEVLKLLQATYEEKIAPLRPEIRKVGKSEKDIIIMASIIDKEAKGIKNEREVISGILWKRLAIARALEVDAAPETYERRGLPAEPIANPGLASIRAAIFPESSPYLYYLHDPEGNIHYARNFEEHKRNKELYLQRD